MASLKTTSSKRSHTALIHFIPVFALERPPKLLVKMQARIFHFQWVRETASEVRIYLVLGAADNHIGLLSALQSEGLLEDGEYFVVGLWEGAWDQEDPSKYLRGLLEDKVDYF